MMNMNDAKQALLKARGPVQFVNYRFYGGFHVFQTVPEDEILLPFTPVMGGYFSVEDETGTVQPFNPKAEPEFWKEPETDLTGFSKLLSVNQ